MIRRPSLKFQLRVDRAKKDCMSIVIRIYSNRKNKYITTPYRIKMQEWLENKQRTKYNTIINTYLDNVSLKFNKFLLEQNTIDHPDEIVNYIFDKTLENQCIAIFFEKFITKKNRNTNVKSKTLLRYKRVLKVFQAFLISDGNSHLPFSKFTLQKIFAWDDYLKSVVNTSGRGLEQNTINKYHSILRTVLLQAFYEGIVKTDLYAQFKLKSKPANRNYLSFDEIQLFQSTKCDSLKEEKVRLIYLFSCYTGLRFEDAQGLLNSNIKRTPDGKKYLSFVSNKTNKQQEIPLLKQADFILMELSQKFVTELIISGRLLPKISNQKFNDYLKILALKIGISKKLTHHTARHTFATFMLNKGVAPQALQVLLGHSNLRETMLYAKISPGYLYSELSKANSHQQ